MMGPVSSGSKSAKFLLWGSLVACLLLRLYFESAYIDFNFDKARQLVVAENYAAGHGYSLLTPNLEDLSQSTFEGVNHWPIGYSLCVSLASSVFGSTLCAAQALDMVVIVLLVGALFSVLGTLGVSDRARAGFLLFTGLTFSPYYYLGSTDLWSVAALFVALAVLLRWHANGMSGRTSPILCGVLLVAATFFRYPYAPFAVALPATLCVAGVWRRDRSLRNGGLWFGSIVAIGLIAMFGYQAHLFGSAMRSTDGEGVFFSNLAHMDSFALKSLGYTTVLTDNLYASLPSVRSVVEALTLLSSAIILALVLSPAAKGLRRGLSKKQFDTSSLYHVLAAVTIVINVGLVVWTSLTHQAMGAPERFFTHVQLTRYYVPSMLFIQIALVLSFLSPGRELWRRAGRVVLGLSLAFALAYSGYRSYKVHVLEADTIYEQKIVFCEQMIRAMRRVAGDDLSNAIYTESKVYSRSCLLELQTNVRVVLDYHPLIARGAKSTEPLDLFVFMPHSPSSAERAFLAKFKPVVVEGADDGVLYHLRLGS